MAIQPGPPSHEALVRDLRTLRERGLLQVRHLELPALHQAAGCCSTGPDPAISVEALVRLAAERLGADGLGVAAGYTLGLTPGTRDWPGRDRRRRAAEVYGVGEDRFRKHHERLILEQVAEQILAVCAAEPAPAAAPERRSAEEQTVRVAMPGHGSITLHCSPIELITGIDVLVSSENVHLEMSKIFKSSVSAALRRSGARRSAAGEIVDDVIQRELGEWLGEFGRHGLPVAPGVVAVTSGGDLAAHGVRRIYHAAIATPRPGTNDYDCEPSSIVLAVRNVFRLATLERRLFQPELRSICFPLLGAGRAGLTHRAAITWLWTALDQSIPRYPGWSIHLSVRRPDVSVTVLDHLTGCGGRVQGAERKPSEVKP